MEREELAKLVSLETRIKYSEDRIDKLFRFVLEGNGRPSLQSEVALLKESIKTLEARLLREDTLIRESINYLNEAIDDLSGDIQHNEEEEERNEPNSIALENIKGRWTAIAALATSIVTIGGMFFSNLPALIEVMSNKSNLPPSLVEGDSSIYRPLSKV